MKNNCIFKTFSEIGAFGILGTTLDDYIRPAIRYFSFMIYEQDQRHLLLRSILDYRYSKILLLQSSFQLYTMLILQKGNINERLRTKALYAYCMLEACTCVS